MHASVNTYKVMDVDGLVHKIQEELVDRVKAIDGFIGYFVIDGADGTVIAITLGETEDAVQTSTSRAQDWVVQRAAHLIEGSPDMTAGEVRVHAGR
jgi:hypothetical protein